MATKSKPALNEIINPKANIERRLADIDAEDDDDYVAPEAQRKAPATMTQADMSGYGSKPKPKATPPAAVLKRAARD